MVLWRGVVTVGAFSIVINLLMLSIPIYMFQISDRVFSSQSMDTLVMLSLLAAGALSVLVVLDSLRRFVMTRVAMQYEALLGGPLLTAALTSADIAATRDVQALRDLQQVRFFMTGPVMMIFFDAPLAPIYFLVVFLIHPMLGAVTVASGVILLGLAWCNQRATARALGLSGSHAIKASLQAAAQARNAQVICAMGMQEESVRLWGRENAAALSWQVMATDRNTYLTGLTKLVRLTTQVILLGGGAYLALNGELTGGAMIAASLVASRALAPVESAIEGWRSYVQAKSSYRRMRHLLETSAQQSHRITLPRAEGRLNVESLLYLAPGSRRPILNGVSFGLDPGESLAIVGPSGGGKSTLARMIVGCIPPTSGCVRLDLMDLRNWDRRQLGENVGYLPQDIELFPGTIKANIARMRDDVPDEAVVRAAQLAGVHELISRFPDGYETEIAADGSPLSGGQKQQIALARAFFGDPRLLVLDEPNANLDPNGEEALERALVRAKEIGITVVLVTQRPGILRSVNKILAVKQGQVFAFGDRDDVLSRLSAATQQPSQSRHATPPAPPSAAEPQHRPEGSLAQV